MLIQPDKSNLGDGKLNPREALLKSFEDTDRRLMRFRLDDHEHLKDIQARLGRPMPHTELIRRVLKLNPRIWVEDSINDRTCVGFYTSDRRGNKKYLVAFEKGFLPEFSYILVDRADLPVKEKRGWRTVLHRLLHLKALTWKQVLEAFGDAVGMSSERWRMNTQHYRS